jgi:hypothetical protein
MTKCLNPESRYITNMRMQEIRALRIRQRAIKLRQTGENLIKRMTIYRLLCALFLQIITVTNKCMYIGHYHHLMIKVKGKGKEIAVQAVEAPRFRDDRHIKAALTPRKHCWYSFLLQAESQPQSHSAAWRMIFFMFCWPCILYNPVNKANLVHNLFLAYLSVST